MFFCSWFSQRSYFKYDEGTSLCKTEFLNYSLLKLPSASENLTTFKDHQPLYYLFLRYWKKAFNTDNVWLLRLPSIAFFSISVMIFFLLVQMKSQKMWISVPLTHIYILNFQNLDMSSYVREMSLYLLFCLISLFIFEKLSASNMCLRKTQNWSQLFLLCGIAGGASFYLHYAVTFIGLILIFKSAELNRKLNKLLLFILISSFLFKTYFVFIHRFISRPKEYFEPTFENISLSLWGLFGFYDDNINTVLSSLLVLFFIVAVVCSIIRKGYTRCAYEISLFFFAIISFLFLRYVVHMDETTPRYFIFALPCFLLTVATIRNRKTLIFLILTLSFVCFSDLAFYMSKEKQENMKTVFDYFHQNRTPLKIMTHNKDTTYCYFQSMYHLRYSSDTFDIFEMSELKKEDFIRNNNVIVVDETENGKDILAFKNHFAKEYPSFRLVDEKKFKFEKFNPNFIYFAKIKELNE